MNKAILMGRLTRDPEMRTTSSNISVCTFTLAIDRKFKNAAGEKQADFIQIVAWRQLAEFCSKYFHKGSRMLVTGTIQSRSWDDTEGKRHSVTEVVADDIEFVDTKKSEGSYESAAPSQTTAPAAASDGFFPGPDDDTALPFDI